MIMVFIKEGMLSIFYNNPTMRSFGLKIKNLSLGKILIFSIPIVACVIVLASIDIVQSNIPIILGDTPQIFLLILKLAFVIGAVVIVFSVLIKLISFLFGLLIICISNLKIPIPGFRLSLKIFQKENEFYINVRNLEFLFNITRIFLHTNFMVDHEACTDPIIWIEPFSKNGELSISRRKSKNLHLATIDYVEKKIILHAITREIILPFQNDSVLDFWINGNSSASGKRKNKCDINVRFLILENIINGQIVFTFNGVTTRKIFN
jgi:hypothetical protein